MGWYSNNNTKISFNKKLFREKNFFTITISTTIIFIHNIIVVLFDDLLIFYNYIWCNLVSNARKRLKKGIYVDPDSSKTQNKAELADQLNQIRTSFKKHDSTLINLHTSSRRNLYIIGGLIVVVLLGGIVLAFNQIGSYATPPPNPGGQLSYTSACLTDIQVNIHFHPFLTISLYGNSLTIPADIGIGNSCNRPIHTHDSSGYIHVESSTSLNLPEPTLGDFFAIWQQTFPSDNAGQWTGTVSAVVTLDGSHYGTYYGNTTSYTAINNKPLLDGGQTINGYQNAGEDIALTITQ